VPEIQPPPEPLWDLPLDRAPLVFLDLEMTGLNTERDHVVEVCLERWVGETKERTIASLVRPPAHAGKNAHVHGLSAEALETAPAFESLADDIRSILDGAIPIAHAAEWDVNFLRAEMERAKRPFEVTHWIDTLVLSRRAFGLDSHSLAALCAHFKIDPGKAHRATDDVHSLRAIFGKCVEVLEPKSARDLWHVRIAERHARPAIVEACEQAAKTGAAMRITYRPSHRGAHELVIVVKEMLKDAKPPRVIAYEVESRARRELRADRILQIEPAK
jgi:DNA polymerase-3 subunit epsilon